MKNVRLCYYFVAFKDTFTLTYMTLNSNTLHHSPIAGSRSTLFAATDPQVPEYCELLKADKWPVCAFLAQECRPTNPSEEAHNVETAYRLWEKTLEMTGLHSDVVEKLLEGDQITCRYGADSTETN